MERERRYEEANKEVKTLRDTLAAASGIWLKQLNGYRMKYPNDNWDVDASITDKLRTLKIEPMNVKDYCFLEVHTDKTVEVPVQDTRTKNMIHLLMTNIRKLSEKYPQIKS